MVHFVISGKPDCKNMVQALNVAYYLKKNLPHFEYMKNELRNNEEWDEYIVKVNREHKWHHAESPLIFKETYFYGSKKPILIGGLSEFWEYCYDYYGLECIMTSEEIQNLLQDNMRNFTKDFIDSYNESRETLNVMIYGASNDMTTILLPQFMMIDGFDKKNSFNFILYDEKLDFFSYHYFDDFMEEFKDMFGTKVEYCDNLGEGLRVANLLIFTDDTSGLEEDGDDALKTYLLQINYLAEEINLCAKRDLKIVFANDGISCLIATILARKILHVPHSQIVVVSSDLGLGYLGEISRRTNIKTDKLGAPPVWGSLGLNEFVDAGSALMKCNVCKPYPRAVRASPNSTLMHGTKHCELRFINYLTDEIENLQETVTKRRAIIKEKLRRAPMFAKLQALVNLMKIWYGRTTLKDPIISLGVMSDGSFNIPEKIVFSQPAIQFRGGWVPYSKYPVPEHILDAIMTAGEEAHKHYLRHCNTAFDRKSNVLPTVSKYRSTTMEKPSYSKELLARSKYAF